MDSSKHKGYMLIEVMVTVSLLAIGMTGFTFAQLKAMRLNVDAQTSSDITLANAAIIDQLRLHPDKAANGEFNIRLSSRILNNPPRNVSNELDAIISALNWTGINASIDISCETELVVACEICFEKLVDNPQAVESNSHGDIPSTICNRQIIM